MIKILKVLATLLLGLLVLLLGGFLYFWISNQLFIEGVDEENTAYLSQNKEEINPALVSPEADIELFNNDFYHNQVFLLGENHGFADVQLIDQYMLKHLNKKIGLRYYLAEMDSIRATKLNEFLEKDTKDSLLLKQVIRDIGIRIPQQSSKELYQKWLEIYDYNQSLADSLKITVIGIDKNFEDTSPEISRDSAMLLNFQKEVELKGLENEKFYGFFGYTHVLASSFGEKDIYPFAAKVKRSNLPYAQKLQSLVCFTLDSEVILPENDQVPTPPDGKTALLNHDGPILLAKGIKDLKEVTRENSITLFHLDKPNSPYRNNQKLASIKVNLFGDHLVPSDEKQSTTDFFQYVFLIRNSNALSKLD